MLARAVLLLVITSMSPLLANTNNTAADIPPIEPGVSLELARWRAARYSDVRYKLNLTLEKMSPVLKGTMEIRVNVGARTPSSGMSDGTRTPSSASLVPPLILDWRKIKGHEEKSTITNVSINGTNAVPNLAVADEGVRVPYEEHNEHLIFREGVVIGENVIKLEFTSPILTSGSAITRYMDKEDGSEYIYSLFVPSDASTAFPVFDQPDLKASFQLSATVPFGWKIVSNSAAEDFGGISEDQNRKFASEHVNFEKTKPISTYVFAFAAGEFTELRGQLPASIGSVRDFETDLESRTVALSRTSATNIYVRKSQVEKFKPHAAEVFRLNREAIKYFEEYFDYKFPFPKYDLVLIPEFPFGGMEHAGATFLRESSIIFPQEPTKNDHISRALLIFHEASHQWFGDMVTMRWFDDLWLKEGFATFTAYKAMERIMPEMLAWKVFYERVKQAAYRTDSTKGTTPIYQEINNLSAAKSAYGNIVYNKAPAFLRQAEFYLGEDKFQTAVRAFLKKHEFGNAGWEDLVGEFEAASRQDLKEWAKQWVTQRGLARIDAGFGQAGGSFQEHGVVLSNALKENGTWRMRTKAVVFLLNGKTKQMESETREIELGAKPVFSQLLTNIYTETALTNKYVRAYFANYQDYGYGIFLLDPRSREYVLKNIQNEKDPFLRSMMWGALWDSVREGELDPREYVETVLRVLRTDSSRQPKGPTPNVEDESTTALLLNRVGTAMNYYIDAERVSSPHVSKGSALSIGRIEPSLTVGLQTRLEDMLIDRMRNAPTLGQRITFYRALLNIAASENARNVLKQMLRSVPSASAEGPTVQAKNQSAHTEGTGTTAIPLKTKDKFDIVTRLLILNDPEAPKLLSELEKTETSDDAKRYAYSARAGIATAENKAKYWNDFVNNKEISESWIEAAFGPWNSIRHSELTLPYLERALKELPNHKRNRKIFFVNGWLGAFIGGQRSEEALNIINKFLAENATLDKDLRLKVLENADIIERAVRIRAKY